MARIIHKLKIKIQARNNKLGKLETKMVNLIEIKWE